MGLFSSPTPYHGQVYSDLRKQAQTSGHPFIDTDFPPDDKSLFYTKGKLAGVEWKRPKDICENPKLFVEGTSSGDVSQGQLGNCWFVAAASCLANEKAIWQKVIPNHKDQEWDDQHPEKYGGIFHFQFWRYGEWIDVVIDDFLPTIGGQLCFVHSTSKNEFWSALLEKAYAKLFGCYEALDGGSLEEALTDFTGGIAEDINIKEGQYATDTVKQMELWDMAYKEIQRRSLMAAAIPAQSADEMEAKTDTGLVKGHAYGITAVKKVPLEGTGLFNFFKKDKIKMVRLRNPWGGVEWTGAFSDGSPEWEKIGKGDREKLGLTFEDDGEFWMTFDDFCTYFTNMAICRVVNTSFFSLHKAWWEAKFHGAWKNPMRAGGCLNNKDTFLRNPQYVFKITDEEDEVMISLMQKSGRGDGDPDKLTVGFSIMKVEENRRYRVHRPQEIVKSSAFRNSRSIFLRHTLKKGRYVLLPCTFEPGKEGQFLLRMYTSSDNDAREIIRDLPPPDLWMPCFLQTDPQQVAHIVVKNAVGLERQDTAEGGADPYCIISCEGEKVTTPVQKDTLNPGWDTAAIFYRKKPLTKPVKVQIWNSNNIRDEFMGQAIFVATEPCESKILEVDLYGRKNEKATKKPGKLIVEMTICKEVDAL
ncbi:calpain-5 isoform X3 [Lingula anatina]|uniref:Calpain-5 isoform X3 n=1 Tax=Lingula anatina TaxID=7574 RepID=A0A1S3IUQ5_LINAN|nr:calpain-5 isoform X3 [Lingula anatina]|eukprot:XP_013401269.1 calpain-5 isoform X3 [Lingula anatina]